MAASIVSTIDDESKQELLPECQVEEGTAFGSEKRQEAGRCSTLRGQTRRSWLALLAAVLAIAMLGLKMTAWSPVSSLDEGAISNKNEEEVDNEKVDIEGDPAKIAESAGDAQNAKANAEDATKTKEEETHDKGEASKQETQDSIDAMQTMLKDLEAMQQQLSGPEKVDGKALVESMMKEGEQHDDGTVLDVKTLVARYGVLRGVTLYGTASVQVKDSVLQLKESVLAMSNDKQARLMTAAPDTSTTETSVQSNSASSVENVNSYISSFGMSSLKSSSFNLGASVSYGSVASVGFGISDSRSNSESSGDKSVTNEQDRKDSSEFTMSKYFFEPRQVLAVDIDLTEKTSGFQEAIEALKVNHDSSRVGQMLTRFGTHVCSRALLGGYWRTTATVHSEEAQSWFDNSRVASDAISSSLHKGFGLNASGGIGAFSAGFSVDSSQGSYDAENSDSGSQTGGQEKVTKSNVNLYQERKGGTEAADETSWKESLSYTKNSNWRIIDRYADSCLGIWALVDDPSLADILCVRWQTDFAKSLEIPPANLNTCQGNTLAVRHALMKVRAENVGKDLEDAKAKCAEKEIDGLFFDETSWNPDAPSLIGSACREKVCLCGSAKGATGKDCPTNGVTACTKSQRAPCTKMQCPPTYLPNVAGHDGDSELLCAYQKCSQEVDLSTCCHSINLASSFILRMNTCEEHWSETESQIWVTFTKGVYATGGWVKEEHNLWPKKDWQQVEFHAPYAFEPDKVCFRTEGEREKDKWCVVEVKIYNAEEGVHEYGRIGTATFGDSNWVSSTDVCRTINKKR